MCGICGIFDFTGHPEITHERLQAMADTMIHRGRTKHILKEAARGILPDEVIDRPKTVRPGVGVGEVTS